MLPIATRSREEVFENTSFELVEYGRSDKGRGFAIYIFNPCLRIFLAWDEYHPPGKHC